MFDDILQSNHLEMIKNFFTNNIISPELEIFLFYFFKFHKFNSLSYIKNSIVLEVLNLNIEDVEYNKCSESIFEFAHICKRIKLHNDITKFSQVVGKKRKLESRFSILIEDIRAKCNELYTMTEENELNGNEIDGIENVVNILTSIIS